MRCSASVPPASSTRSAASDASSTTLRENRRQPSSGAEPTGNGVFPVRKVGCVTFFPCRKGGTHFPRSGDSSPPLLSREDIRFYDLPDRKLPVGLFYLPATKKRYTFRRMPRCFPAVFSFFSKIWPGFIHSVKKTVFRAKFTRFRLIFSEYGAIIQIRKIHRFNDFSVL